MPITGVAMNAFSGDPTPGPPSQSREEGSSESSFDGWLSIRQAAADLGMSRATLYRLMGDRKIAFQQISPRRRVIQKSALRAYLEAVTRGPSDSD